MSPLQIFLSGRVFQVLSFPAERSQDPQALSFSEELWLPSVSSCGIRSRGCKDGPQSLACIGEYLEHVEQKEMVKLWCPLVTSCYTIWKPGFTKISNYGKCPSYIKTPDSQQHVSIILGVMKVRVKCMYVSIKVRVKFIRMKMVGLWGLFIFCCIVFYFSTMHRSLLSHP